MNTLTVRILALLSSKPTSSVDIWDALGDSAVSLADVRAELSALVDEDRVLIDGSIPGRPAQFRSVSAVAVAS